MDVRTTVSAKPPSAIEAAALAPDVTELLGSRLMPTATAGKRSIRDIQRNIEKIRLQDLPQELLRKMDAELRGEQDELEQRAVTLQESLTVHLTRGEGSVIGEHKKEIRRIARAHDELSEERKKVFDALQHRILDDRLVEVFGSRWLVSAIEYFIMGLIFIVLGMLVYEMMHPDMPEHLVFWFNWIDIGACGIFLSEFSLRWWKADNKRWFWRNHWIDFVTSIPLPNLQALRIGRMARVARFARVARAARLLRVLRVIFFFWRGMDKLTDVFDVKLMKRSIILALLFLLGGAAVIYAVEGQHEGVNTPWESIWWSFTTVVTGGFGDLHNPQTATGRVLTVILIIAGMVVIGIFTATLTSVLVGDDSEALELMQKDLNAKLDALNQRMNQISRPGPSGGPSGSGNGGSTTGRLMRRGPPS